MPDPNGRACLTRMAAQVGSTNLMNQVTGAMDQKLSGVKGAGILSPVGSKFSMFVGHDENISAISAFLGVLNWQADGFQPNDPGPTGALVFELHKVKFTGEHIVRLFYVIPTLNQMRNGTALTLDTPPQRLPLSIAACEDSTIARMTSSSLSSHLIYVRTALSLPRHHKSTQEISDTVACGMVDIYQIGGST